MAITQQFVIFALDNSLMRSFIFTIFLVFAMVALASGQNDTTNTPEVSDDAVIFLDGVNANKADIEDHDPTEIAFITIVKGGDANHTTNSRKDAIYVYTKKYAREQYWNYFKSKSPRYAEIVQLPGLDTHVVYIINGSVLEENVESLLYDVNDSNFIDLKVIDEKELKKQFKIRDKKWGVVLMVK